MLFFCYFYKDIYLCLYVKDNKHILTLVADARLCDLAEVWWFRAANFAGDVSGRGTFVPADA